MNRIGITAGASAEQTTKAANEVQVLAERLALPLDAAVEGLDTLVASGMSLEEAMEFLPSVLEAAQASGAATSDMANTAQKAASALGLTADEMQKAFDIMVTGGKAGQFELKDMAQYIPELANSFASLGYEGEEGLKMLVALLQTVREDTGSAGSAATQLQNIFGKMFSEETANKFDKMGVNLAAEMKKARDNGEGLVEAFVRISKQTIDGDLTKLPALFTDQEFRLGMQSLITSEESLRKFLETVNGAEVEGAVFRDLNRILSDTQTEIDQLGSSWDQFMKTVGGAAAGPVKSVLDSLTSSISYETAVATALEKRGEGWFERNLRFGHTKEQDDALARSEGWTANEHDRRVLRQAPVAYKTLGRMPQRPGYRGEYSQPTPQQGAAQVDSDEAARNAMLTNGMNVLAPLEERLNSINSNLAAMTGQVKGVDATITDARQDNRQFPVTTTVSVGGVHVTQAVEAPAALGQAVGNAAATSINSQASRIAAEPASAP